jgi:hypothetical protein
MGCAARLFLACTPAIGCDGGGAPAIDGGPQAPCDEALAPATPGTVDGPLAGVDDWVYQLQGRAELALGPIVATDYDLAVIDYSRDGSESGEFTAAEYRGPDGLQALADEIAVLRPREIVVPEGSTVADALPDIARLQLPVTGAEVWSFEPEAARRTLLDQFTHEEVNVLSVLLWTPTTYMKRQPTANALYTGLHYKLCRKLQSNVRGSFALLICTRCCCELCPLHLIP